MKDEGYFKRSWALLTRDKGWIKPILIMTAASLVPIAGFLGIQGYALEWARLTAWGVDSSPKQKNVDIGGCITSGARAFVVSLGLGLAVSIATGIVTAVFSAFPDALGLILGSIASMATSVVTVVSGTFILACQLRCAIYEQIGAGYRVDRVFEMVKRDTSGFVRLVLLSFVCSLVVGTVVFVFVMIAMIGIVPVIMLAANGGSTSAMTSAVLAAIGPIIFAFSLFVLVCDFLGNGILLIEATACALWFREFDVASWGKSEDPLPEVGASASWNPVAPTGATARQPEVESRPQLEAGPQTQAEQQPAQAGPQSRSVPQPRELEVEPVDARAQVIEADPVEEAHPQSEGTSDGDPAESASSAGVVEEVKDVDSLYADLYDVIQRDNHSDEQ